MSNNLNYFQLIDDYLSGSLSVDQMRDFESQLSTDPLLKEEFLLQKDIVNSLMDYRKAELKAYLNNVNVGVGTGSVLLGMKTAAIVAVTAIVGVGAYFFLRNDNPELFPDKIDLVDSRSLTEVTIPHKPELKEIVVLEEEISRIEETESVAIEKPEIPDQVAVVDSDQSSEKAVVVNSPRVLNLMDEDNTDSMTEANLEIPDKDIAQTTNLEHTTIAVEPASDQNYDFHYQYHNGKLFLYGDFKDAPYEILELNSGQNKQLYMQYNNIYYIIEESRDIIALEPLTRPDIIKKLDIIQEHK